MGKCVEDLIRVHDHICQLPVALGQGVEDNASVPNDRLQVLLLPVEQLDDLRCVCDERADVAEGIVDIEAAVLDGNRGIGLPALEGAAGFLVEGIEDLVDLGRVLNLGIGELSVLGDRLDADCLGIGDV